MRETLLPPVSSHITWLSFQRETGSDGPVDVPTLWSPDPMRGLWDLDDRTKVERIQKVIGTANYVEMYRIHQSAVGRGNRWTTNYYIIITYGRCFLPCSRDSGENVFLSLAGGLGGPKDSGRSSGPSLQVADIVGDPWSDWRDPSVVSRDPFQTSARHPLQTLAPVFCLCPFRSSPLQSVGQLLLPLVTIGWTVGRC